jgi:Leucine-rich repeat (LRR) protein
MKFRAMGRDINQANHELLHNFWQMLPVELTRLQFLEKLYLDNNKLSVLPPEVGALKNMKVLSFNNNMLVSVPG